jgi:hypothetical protein
MSSDAMTYTKGFIKIGSGIQKSKGGGGGIHRHKDIQTAWRTHMPTFFLFFLYNRLQTLKRISVLEFQGMY